MDHSTLVPRERTTEELRADLDAVMEIARHNVLLGLHWSGVPLEDMLPPANSPTVTPEE